MDAPLGIEVRTSECVSRELSGIMASSGSSKSAAQHLTDFTEFSARLGQRPSTTGIPAEALRPENMYGDDER